MEMEMKMKRVREEELGIWLSNLLQAENEVMSGRSVEWVNKGDVDSRAHKSTANQWSDSILTQ